ncbi:MAG TPA: hypothetical protein VN844_05265 [Pyrinomonadaceae bacterium]|nr:hypothetical protein [Pyrinomonadaceae bacterium]
MSQTWPETNKRDVVGKLVGPEPVKALELARSIADPWYRCQSLAHVAWHLKDQLQSSKIIKEALTAAFELDQPNRIVSVASWAVRVMVKNGDQRLGLVVDELLDKIQLELNPIRQADALLFLFEAVYHEPQLRDRVLDPLLRACEQMKSWKRPRILSDIARVLAIDDPNRASQVVDTIGEGRYSRRTRSDIDAGKWLGPHEFFPYYAKQPSHA